MSSTASKKGDAITRSDLADAVAKSGEMTGKAALALADCIIDSITETLAKGDDVLISGFGKFAVLKKKSRTGRNPQTGAAVQIPARSVVRFRASDSIKSSVNG